MATLSDENIQIFNIEHFQNFIYKPAVLYTFPE